MKNSRIDLLASLTITHIPCLPILCLVCIRLAKERTNISAFLLTSNSRWNRCILNVDIFQEVGVICWCHIPGACTSYYSDSVVSRSKYQYYILLEMGSSIECSRWVSVQVSTPSHQYVNESQMIRVLTCVCA
jgi:hypothetical protein